MGKPTGFLEYKRETARVLPPKFRIANFNEFRTPLSKEKQKTQGARCMACTCNLDSEPVATKENERAIIETAWQEGWVKPQIPHVRTGKTIAVVGSGPSGHKICDTAGNDAETSGRACGKQSMA